MAKEIERKFLVDLSKLNLKNITHWTTKIEQGYLNEDIQKTIRIRIEDEKFSHNDTLLCVVGTSPVTDCKIKKAFLTIKGKTEKRTYINV